MSHITSVQSLSEYVQSVCNVDRGLVRDGSLHNEILLFRGQSNADYELLPSLGRSRRFAVGLDIFREERNLIELAKFKLPDVFRNDMLPLELLALLQHHGIPTRLLDVTENALVALFFACNANDKKDGEVIVFKYNELDITNYPVVQAIADSYRFARATSYPLSLFYGAVKEQPYFLEQKQMNEICHKTNEAGGEWIAECCKEPFFVYAPIRSLRQQMQRGRYILFPNRIKSSTFNDKESKYFSTVLDAISKDSDCIAERIIIPGNKKSQLLSDLALMGISKETLFGDSIDKVCESIVETCKKRIRSDGTRGKINWGN